MVALEELRHFFILVKIYYVALVDVCLVGCVDALPCRHFRRSTVRPGVVFCVLIPEVMALWLRTPIDRFQLLALFVQLPLSFVLYPLCRC